MAGRSLVLLVCALGALAATARASTLVPMSDRDLVSSAAAVVEAAVVAVEPHYVEERQAVYSYVTLDVVRTLKGDVPPGLLVLRQLGGVTRDRATVIFGAPEFDEGERLVLFLNADEDGALHVAHLRLGVFRVEQDASSGALVVVRDDVMPVTSPVTGEPITTTAAYARFVAEVLDVSGSRRVAAVPVRIVPPEYLLAPQDPESGHHFSFLGSGYRWFEPDASQRVRIKVNKRNAPSPSGGVDEAKAAFRAWSSVAGSALEVQYDGSTTAGGLRTDDVAAVSFGDPRGQIDDLVNCQGIVALAGLSASISERITIGNKTFARITESDLVVNNGIECLVGNNLTLLSEIIAHEFGHDLGLGHSSENPAESNTALRDATMYFVTHNDGRGASIRQDDAEGIRFLYRRGLGALSVASGVLPDAVPGEAYSFSVEATGGTAPYAWSVTSGSLPNGITLATNGLLAGTASVEVATAFTIRVQDAAGAAETRDVVLEVTRTPSPFLAGAAYSLARQRLSIAGRYLDEQASVTVNNTRIAPPANVSYKPRKMRLFIRGSTSALNVKRDGNDAVYVTIGGRPSNTIRF